MYLTFELKMVENVDDFDAELRDEAIIDCDGFSEERLIAFSEEVHRKIRDAWQYMARRKSSMSAQERMRTTEETASQ